MRIRDKMITAACRTKDGMEWTSLKIKQDGVEQYDQGTLPLPVSGESVEEMLSSAHLPDDVSEHLTGDITVALRTSDLLMRTMEFPTADSAEIADMVDFQIDKVSPFPVDQLATSHEILDRSEDKALVLMAAAKRECIDSIGDAFEQRGIHIRSIDARILGWLRLLRDENALATEGSEILIIADDIDFSMAITLDGKPLAFRSLHAHLDDMNVVDDLVQEISYTLTTLDAEHDLPAPSAIQFWSHSDTPAPLQLKLREKTGLAIDSHSLGVLPHLSEGIVRRALDDGDHIELIPQEWIDLQNRKKLTRQFSFISSIIAATWLLVLLVFFSIYKVRDISLGRVKERAEAIAPAAREAQENQRKLKALKVYTDRSNSSLECLREITRTLPMGDIEFVSYNYTKDKGVTLRGTGRDRAIVTDYFSALNKLPLFDGIRNESVNDKTTKGVKRAVFSVTLPLAPREDSK